MRLSRSLAILAFSLVVLCGAGFADSFTFAGPTGDIGPSKAYTSGSSTITLYGFSADTVATDLYRKNEGGDESGIGLNNGGSDHEIAKPEFIQVKGTGIASITIGSIQAGEKWAIYGSNTVGVSDVGVAANLIAKGTGGQTKTALTSGYTIYTVYSSSGDILLDSVNTSTVVPEPGTPALLMTLGLVGLLAFGGRKLGKISI
jgi:hypothetical protein